jgi:D-arabinose 1-dehydrogenase-like Zn-dependent alcohol dehydrogenase
MRAMQLALPGEPLQLTFLDAGTPAVPVTTTIETFPLARANEALARLHEGRVSGAAVLQIA